MSEFTARDAANLILKIEEWLTDRWKTTNEPNFTNENTVVAKVICQDGSHMFFHDSLVVKYQSYWFIITEHWDSHWFHEDEVDVILYKRLWDHSSILQEFIDGIYTTLPKSQEISRESKA